MSQNVNPYQAPTANTAVGGVQVGSGQAGSFAIGEVLGVGWEAVKRQPVELVGGVFVVTILMYVANALPQGLIFTGLIPAGTGGAIVVALVGMVFNLLVQSFFTIGLMRAGLLAARGEAVDFSVYFSGGDRFGTNLICSLLEGLGVLLGFLLLVVPGIIVALGWTFASTFVADSECSASEALSESWQITKGQKLNLIGLGIASCLVIIGGLLCLGLGIFVALPVVLVAFAAAYVRLSGNASSPA